MMTKRKMYQPHQESSNHHMVKEIPIPTSHYGKKDPLNLLTINNLLVVAHKYHST